MFNFKVSPDGKEPYEVTATARDVAKWERTNKGAALAQLGGDGTRMTDFYKIAYHASVRHGQFTGTVTEFEDNCDIEAYEVEGSANPTQPAQ